jgi:hypothetical protein
MPSRSLRSTPACPPISDVRGRDLLRPLNVDSGRPRLIGMMSLVNTGKVEAAHRQAQDSGKRMVGAFFKRTLDEAGKRVQRAAIRFDNVARCLRTLEGGSSRQYVIVIDGGEVRSRLLSQRESASLMGLADTYALPSNANAGLSSNRRRRGRADGQLPGGAPLSLSYGLRAGPVRLKPCRRSGTGG